MSVIKVLDLFSGLGGFSQAFTDRGHEVITVEIEPRFYPSIVADINHLPIKQSAHFDIILASPPCDDFSKAEKPWYPVIVPDMGLLETTLKVIEELKPKYWVIENVRGAVPYFHPYLKKPIQHCGSRYLWGNFPKFYCNHQNCYGKEKLWPNPRRKELRALIPYEISMNLCLSIESAISYNFSITHGGKDMRRIRSREDMPISSKTAQMNLLEVKGSKPLEDVRSLNTAQPVERECPICKGKLDKRRDAYVVYGCKVCNKTFYFRGKTTTELIFSYAEFFAEA